jgi:lipoprotein-anchoring transpeptidase ErfK/SrfK
MLKNKFILIFSIIAGAFLIAITILESAGYYALHHKKILLMKNNAAAVNNGEKALNLEEQNDKLVKQIRMLAPNEIFIVIDTAQNILYLKQGDEVVRKAVISTGSGNVLTEPTGRKRSWTFDTPRGEFAIKTLAKDPLWTEPDWEFISEGKAIPKNKADRIKEGYLGDYKLGIGNDIYIHGYLYKTMGKHVTHGCIRVGDDDLEAIWKTSKIGTKVFIF